MNYLVILSDEDPDVEEVQIFSVPAMTLTSTEWLTVDEQSLGSNSASKKLEQVLADMKPTTRSIDARNAIGFVAVHGRIRG